MQRQEVKLIGSVLQELLQEERFSQKLNETRLIASWGKIVGETVGAYTEKIYVKNKILYVKITLPAVKSDLMMQMEEIKQKLHQEVGCEVIDEIHIY
ncbi:MAG: DUF721 domain-containing protein [Bacteroidales bacterium]|nr:DUF721 domain-containing protein [Bacteroidales bacterium]